MPRVHPSYRSRKPARIVHAKPSDARRAAGICRASWEERYVDFMPRRPISADTPKELVVWMAALIAQRSGGVFIAMVHGESVGVAAYRFSGPSQIELQQFFVAPGYQQAGIGHTLFKSLTEMALDRGAQIWLLAARDNVQARRWYEARGAQTRTAARISWNGYVLPMVRYTFPRLSSRK